MPNRPVLHKRRCGYPVAYPQALQNGVVKIGPAQSNLAVHAGFAMPVLSTLATVRIVEHLLACTKNSRQLCRRFDERQRLNRERPGGGLLFSQCFLQTLAHCFALSCLPKSRYTNLVVVVNTTCFLWISYKNPEKTGTCSEYKAVNNFV